MWVITPGESISARVKVSPAFTSTLGETFHPCPRSRAASAPVPSVARPPPPGEPSKFAGLMDRVRTGRRRASEVGWGESELEGAMVEILPEGLVRIGTDTSSSDHWVRKRLLARYERAPTRSIIAADAIPGVGSPLSSLTAAMAGAFAGRRTLAGLRLP